MGWDGWRKSEQGGEEEESCCCILGERTREGREILQDLVRRLGREDQEDEEVAASRNLAVSQSSPVIRGHHSH